MGFVKIGLVGQGVDLSRAGKERTWYLSVNLSVYRSGYVQITRI
jgi:hypothetical protein